MTPFERMEELRSKGWKFTLWGSKDGWSCLANGPGLAHSSAGGDSLADAVSHALDLALTMEDDPEVVVGVYETKIRERVLESFGGLPCRLKFRGGDFDFSGHIEIEVGVKVDLDSSDAADLVDREIRFFKSLSDLPADVVNAFVVRYVPLSISA